MMDDSDSLVACPYNKSHVLYKSRMQTHLKKCSYTNQHPQQNVDTLPMKICPFNTNHHIPTAQWNEHYATCPDRDTVHRFVTACNSGQGSAIPYKEIYLPPTEENWDDCEDVSTYNPEEHATTGVILRAAQGVPKAERKTFRMRERERINRIRENEGAHANAAPKPQPVVVMEKSAFTEQALRHPKAGQLGMGRGRNASTNSALSVDDDFAVQGAGRAYTLRGMSNGLRGLPAMRPNVVGASSNAGSTAGSTADSTGGATAGSSSESGHSSSPHSVDGDGFIEQMSKNKKKKKKSKAKAAAPNANGQAHSGMNGQASSSNNPLTTPDSSTFAFPGLPGKGRGRIRKN